MLLANDAVSVLDVGAQERIQPELNDFETLVCEQAANVRL